MIVDPAEAARIEAAFDEARLETRAPIVCVLAQRLGLARRRVPARRLHPGAG